MRPKIPLYDPNSNTVFIEVLGFVAICCIFAIVAIMTMCY